MRIILLALFAVSTGCLTPPGGDGGLEDAGRGAGGGSSGVDGGSSDGGADAGTLRVLVMFNTTSSTSTTDPNDTRVAALRQLLETLPAAPTAVAVMAFAGSSTAYLTGNGKPAFVPLSALSSSDRDALAASLASYSAPADAGDINDWARPLLDAYVLTSKDISALQGSRYSVIFVADGRPSINQDDELLCNDAIRRLRGLRLVGAGDVKVNTVHLFMPDVTLGCNGDAGWQVGSSCRIPLVSNRGVCLSAEIAENANRLRVMSELGAGAFRDFRSHDTVSFTGLAP